MADAKPEFRSADSDSLPDRVNLGCGDDYRDEWHNVDVRYSVTADAYVDLDSIPWPWPDDSFSVALMDNVIEHLDNRAAALAELARVVERGGTVILRYPHWHSAGAYRLGHTQTITRKCFDGYQLGGMFAVREVSCTRIRAGRLLPERLALLLADHVGHIVSEVELTLEVTRDG